MCGGHDVAVASAGSDTTMDRPGCEPQDELIRSMALCSDQVEWLERVARDQADTAGATAWHMLERLIAVANREPSQTKRMIFLSVRCHRCLQHSRGGDKEDYDVELSDMQWKWLENVRQRSKHPTLGKTLRILVDFYKPICEKDTDFERVMFKAMTENEPAVADSAAMKTIEPSSTLDVLLLGMDSTVHGG